MQPNRVSINTNKSSEVNIHEIDILIIMGCITLQRPTLLQLHWYIYVDAYSLQLSGQCSDVFIRKTSFFNTNK